MFPWLPYVLAVYLSALLAGVVMCFVVRSTRRRYIRIGTAMWSIPLWVLLGSCVWLWYHFFREPPKLAELQEDYPAKRADLETILRMSNEDSRFSRIAVDFLVREPDDSEAYSRYYENDPKADLPKDRWDAYRKIYKRNGIELGIQRNRSRDAFVMLRSVGILDSGHVSGYLYCSPVGAPDAYRYEPCTLKTDKGEQKYTGGTEGYSFQRVGERWFAYDQGPG